MKHHLEVRRALFAAASSLSIAWPTAALPQAATSSVPPSDSPSIFAEQPAAAETYDIIVTAQKRDQSLSDVPMLVTAVSAAQLAAKGITDIDGVAKVTPGLSFTESGAGTPVFSLRGIGFNDTTLGAKPTVGVSAAQPRTYAVQIGFRY